eukprot:3183262-Rhodomonas_salina.1
MSKVDRRICLPREGVWLRRPGSVGPVEQRALHEERVGVGLVGKAERLHCRRRNRIRCEVG